MQIGMILIIGAYPKNTIYGGFVSDCIELRNSSIYNYRVLEFDSTQKSNPPPLFIFRLIFSIIRFIKLLFIRFIYKPSHVIALFPSGLGSAEKLFYTSFIFKNAKVFLLPRAGRFFEEIVENKILRYLTNSNRKNLWLVQGSTAKITLNTVTNVSLENIKIIYPFITPRIQTHINTNSIVKIIYVGWLERNKGVYDLIKLCDLNKNNFQLDIYGDGTLRSDVEALTYRDDRVRLNGFIDRHILLALYDTYDLLILPSYTEGFPNSVAESMAKGLAILSSNVGEIPSFIDPECLFSPGDVEQCSTILSRFIQDSTFLSIQKNINYEFACRHFGISFFDNFL
jgi:glycosyltransferase involved in cell wall biosynthesis